MSDVFDELGDDLAEEIKRTPLEFNAPRLVAFLRNRFGGILSYVQIMAARPCVTPGKDCGWCDSCEARTSLAAVQERTT